MNAARKWRLPGIIQVVFVLPVGRKIGGCVEPANRQARDGGVAGMTVLVEVDARGRADRLFRPFVQTGSECLLRPLLLRLGWMAAILEEIGERRFGQNFPIRLATIRHELPRWNTNPTC